MKKVISELCGISEKSYYVWKSKSHIELIKLLEKYFTKDDLQEYNETGQIQRLEKNKNLDKLTEEMITINLRIKIENELKFNEKFLASSFMALLLNRILKKLSLDDFHQEYAKKQLIAHVENFEASIKNLTAENHKKLLIEFIQEKMSNLECYYLIKNKEEFIKWEWK